jgi:hypothetical protein
MRTLFASRSSFARVLAVLLVGHALGCGGNVVVDGAATTTGTTVTGAGPGVAGVGGSTTVTTGSMGSGGPTGPLSAIATMTPDTNPVNPCWALVNSTVSPPPPNAVFLLASNEPISCGSHVAQDIAGDGSGLAWEVCVAVDPSSFTPGEYILQNSEFVQGAYRMVDGATQCGSEGELDMGSITIAAIDSSSVSFSLFGTNGVVFCDNEDIHTDETYQAVRCP